MTISQSYRINKIQLFTSKFENEQVSSEKISQDKIVRDYRAELNFALASTRWLIFFCDFKVSTTIGDAADKLVEATYSITIHYDEGFPVEQRRSAAIEVASKQTWTMFRELFNVVNNQAELGLPALPLEPLSLVVAENAKFDDFDFSQIDASKQAHQS